MISTKTASKIYFITILCSFLSITSLPINPIYPIGAFAIGVVILIVMSRLRINNFTLVTILFSLAFLLSQLEGIDYVSSHIGYPNGPVYLTSLLFVYSILLATCISETSRMLKEKTRTTLQIKVLRIAIFFFLIELITRVLNYREGEGLLYAFKYSVLYFDSNFTGLVLLSLVCFLIYKNEQTATVFNKIKRILTVMLFLTISRGAIIGYLIANFYLNNQRKLKIRSLYIVVISLVCLAILYLLYSFGLVNLINIDGSFNSKFFIINKAIHFYEEQDFMMHLFGIGMGNSKELIDIFAHNIFVTALIEMGWIGTVLFVAYVLYTVRVSHGKSLIIWVPALISGISLFSAYSPFLFIFNAIICCEEREKSRI